jgi:cytochrome c oxidase subunit I
MAMLITSSLLGAVNFLATIINLRARGLTWMRMPFFVWAMMVTGFLLLLAFPPLEVAALMQLSDRLFGSSFFMPTGLVVNGQLWNVSGGGSPLLYQHLFWFLGHPEVYVILLPAIASSPRSFPPTPATRSGATRAWSTPCSCSASFRSSSGPTTCT